MFREGRGEGGEGYCRKKVAWWGKECYGDEIKSLQDGFASGREQDYRIEPLTEGQWLRSR